MEKKKNNSKKMGQLPYKKITTPEGEIYLLGTAHVSAQSVQDVHDSFATLKPDAVCVELCKPRYDSMRDPDRWRKLDLAKVIKEKKLALLASSLILSSFQKKIGDMTGSKPGEEMVVACDLAEAKGLEPVMADREIRITLKRAWGQVGFFSKMWLVSSLVSSLLVKEEISTEEVERMKQEDVLSDLFTSLPKQYDSVKEVIINERDDYLATMILAAAADLKKGKRGSGKKRLLAVVGAGHLAGIEERIVARKAADLDRLNVIPPRSRVRDIAIWMGLSVLLVILGYFIGTGGKEAAQEAVVAWVIGRSAGAGIGALLARAHPLTILVTTVMAPISIFILGSRLWMFSALTELWLKKPRVEDFENIAHDTDSVRGLFTALYQNRVLHLFWIIMLVSFGLTFGNLNFLRTILAGTLKGVL